MTTEPITLGRAECSNAGGIQEKKMRQPSVRYILIWIPTLSRVVELSGLLGPFQLNYSLIFVSKGCHITVTKRNHINL